MGTDYYGGEELIREASDIFSNKNQASNMIMKMVFHTLSGDYPVYTINTIDIEQDFQSSFTDVVHVTCTIPPSDYIAALYPNANNLEATLTIEYVDEYGYIKETYKERFKAILPPDENLSPADLNIHGVDTDEVNKKGPMAIMVQLLNRSAELVRIVPVSGCFEKVTPEKLLKGALAHYGNSFYIDGKDPIPGVDVYPPNNTNVYDRLVLPQGTALVKLPYRLQTKMVGVYSTGIGSYIKQWNGMQTWFVYPLYNTQRFDVENHRKMVVYSINPRRLPGADRTYLLDGNVLYVATTQNIKYHNTQEINLINNGSGFRLPNAYYFMRKPVEMTPDGPIGRRRQINTEVVIKERLDGVQYAPRSDRYVSGNPYVDYSKASKDNTAIISFIWEHSRSDLIYPGMPLKIITGKNQKDKGIKGVILKINTLVSKTGTNLTDGYGVSSSVITAAVEIDKKLES